MKSLIFSGISIYIFAGPFKPVHDEDAVLDRYDDQALVARKDKNQSRYSPERQSSYQSDYSFGTKKGNSTKKPQIQDSLYDKNATILKRFYASWYNKKEKAKNKICPVCSKIYPLQFRFCPSCKHLLVEDFGHKPDLSQMQFLPVHPGKFLMGARDQEPVERENEKFRKGVYITNGFEMMKTELTQGMWKEVMGFYESAWEGDDLPVQKISWNQTQKFIAILNAFDPDWHYRLPTEAEWEYVCRAGTKTAHYFSDTFEGLNEHAWNQKNSENKPQNVARLKTNPWGFFDMSGNVWEWTSDWYEEKPQNGKFYDPKGPEKGREKVYKGGGWASTTSCRCVSRASLEPEYGMDEVGFRLVRTKKP